MKIKRDNQQKTANRQEILHSALASFRIEGITIPEEQARIIFEKVVADLEKETR